jgi:hypothetical protein
MKKETLEEVAQWVINNRYAKSELEKVSDFEMYNTIIDKCSKWQQERSYSEEECEKIADDFAVGFAEWFTNEQSPYSITYGNQEKRFSDFRKDYTINELLEIYKTEKGL